jgi:3',5'-cyclic AMP phosphodiesterase CpdA
MTHIASLLQISDLHFVEDITAEGRAWYARLRDAVKAKPHSFSTVESFAVKVKLLEEARGAFDVILASGDLTTDGSEGACSTVIKFVEQKEYRKGNPTRPIVEGLGADKGRRILLPGNHDRYTRSLVPTQEHSNIYENVLGTPNDYPYVVGYRRPGAPQTSAEPALLFFAFDSTPSEAVSYKWIGGYGTSKFSLKKRFACGRLENRECRWLEDTVKDLIGSNQVKDLNGQTIPIDFNKCVRIAVLHHHPLDKSSTTLMENSSLFIRYCFKAGIDLVLFGHDHKEFYWPEYTTQPSSLPSVSSSQWLQFFCCPSTTEYSAKNGFYVFDFYTSHFTCELYEQKGGVFSSTMLRQLPYGRTI